ncbi:MAG: hypothetical protein ACOVMI_10765 [Chitinophagaceae bacterium]|jgi:hypothetical protein
MKKILVLLLAVSSFFVATSQKNSYNEAIGLRAGYAFAPTYKKFVNDKLAIEGIAFFHNTGLSVQALAQIHNDIKNADGLQWYYGAGANVSFYNKNNYNGVVGVGVVGVIGLDYKFKNAPINLSIDYLPSFSFTSNIGFLGNTWGGLAIRYVLK